MAKFMAARIIAGDQDYAYVIGKRPDLKDGIDVYLTMQGYEELIAV